MAKEAVLTARQLNRATLARQMLLAFLEEGATTRQVQFSREA